MGFLGGAGKPSSVYFVDQHLHLPDHEVPNFRTWICLLSTFQRKSGCIICMLSRQEGLVTCLMWDQTLDEENMLKIMLNQLCRKIISKAGNPVLTICTSHVNRDMSNPEGDVVSSHLSQQCLQCVSPPSAMTQSLVIPGEVQHCHYQKGQGLSRYSMCCFFLPRCWRIGPTALGFLVKCSTARLWPQHLHLFPC